MENAFTKVTKEEFWAWVMNTKRNVHPTPDGRWRSEAGNCGHWYDQQTRELVGRSYDDTGVYYLRSDIL